MNSKVKFDKPFIRNRITITSSFYPDEKSSKPLLTSGMTSSCDIKLIHLLGVLGAFMLITMISLKLMFRK